MSDGCTCSASWYDGDDGWDRDCPAHGVLGREVDSPEFYPDEYFVGFDGSKLAGDGRVALAHRNADGTVQVITVDGFPGPDGEELYASHGYRLRGWDALTLRIWVAQREALAVFDRLEDYWGPWIAALPTDSLFDWMGWRPWEMMRAWIVPPDLFLEPLQNPSNPWLPLSSWPPQPPQQFPRVWGCDAGRRGMWIPPLIPGLDCSLGPNAALVFDTGAPLEDRSRWTLPDYDAKLEHVQRMRNLSMRDILDAAGIEDDAVTLRLWPGEDEGAQ